MKLRIRGNSIRLRLQRSEVRQFLEVGQIKDGVDFGLTRLSYALVWDQDRADIYTTFADHEITIAVPRVLAIRWAASDEVSLKASQPLPAGMLAILVEKDFQCLKPRSVWPEDESDAYPNPNPDCWHA